MTEAQWTSEFVQYQKNCGLISQKHCDRFTTAIPDTSFISVRGTTWLEMKKIKKSENMWDRVQEDKLQFWQMRMIAAFTGRAYYVFYFWNGSVFFVHPELLVNKESQFFCHNFKTFDAVNAEHFFTTKPLAFHAETKQEAMKLGYCLCTVREPLLLPLTKEIEHAKHG